MSELRTQLAIIQATPFCNINCQYCYLPERLLTRRISLETVTKIAERLFESPFVQGELTIVWHAGEPLVLPVSFYEEAHAIINARNSKNINIVWCIQTNAMLINKQWCEFFKRHNVRVGISLDGPKHIHDSKRRDRAGNGTFARVMKGVQLMQEMGISPGVISVITDTTLQYQEDFWQFFIDNGLQRVGLNPEEVEANNITSSIHYAGAEAAYRQFLKGILATMATSPTSPSLREYEAVIGHIKNSGNPIHNQENVPMSIINFDCGGNVSTFSPELLTAKHHRYGNFLLGNVYDSSLEELLQTEKFHEIYSSIQSGVENCRATCEYFMFCGGGSPSNKLGEADTFEVTETRTCRLSIKATVDTIIEHLEERLGEKQTTQQSSL
jgi:uncharacterized protein